MIGEGYDVVATLAGIEPSSLSYDEWLKTGMALHAEGYDVEVFDQWSQRDVRYKPGEPAKKWRSFNGSADGVTGGTIIAIAREHGVEPVSSDGHALDWCDVIGGRSVRETSPRAAREPRPTLRPNEQTALYVEALFGPDELVCLSADVAGQGVHHRAGDLVEVLRGGRGVADLVDGYDPAAGAWCVINPTNGRGRRGDNLTAWRYVLVESDSLSEAEQLALIRRFELPCVAVASSAGKSIHAVVRVDATNAEEHAERARDLFDWCKRHGLELDGATKNPTRFTRIPGVARGERMQELIEVDAGCPSYAAWLSRRSRIESKLKAGALPALTTYADVKDNLPELAPEAVAGVVRQGHKMTLSGPSKSGKSIALLGLTVAFVEGGEWLGGYRCARGPVVYVNLELDERSFWHRLAAVYAAMGLEPDHAADIYVWNLRGHAKDISELADELVAIVETVRPLAIIIDPIYKVNAGDENSAQDMARFTRHLDDVGARTGATVVICHHHSKGAQGGKASRDRASGSGVIARDPDALIDLSELDHDQEAREKLRDRLSIERMCEVLDGCCGGWREKIDLEEQSSDDLRRYCFETLPNETMNALIEELDIIEQRSHWAKPLEVSLTLREFPDNGTKRLWFMYPIHVSAGDELKAARVDGAAKPKKTPTDYTDETLTAFSAIAVNDETTVKEIAEYLGIVERQARTRIDKAGLKRDHGKVSR